MHTVGKTANTVAATTKMIALMIAVFMTLIICNTHTRDRMINQTVLTFTDCVLSLVCCQRSDRHRLSVR
jgi:hypothetical protein